MSGIDQITDKIQADLQAEIDEIRENSAKEVRALGEKYDSLRQSEYWKVINEGTKTAAQRIERARSMAELEARKSILRQKQELVSKAFDLAVTRLASLPEREYVVLLAGFAAEGALSGSEQLIFSQSDRLSCGKKVCALANEKLEAEGKKGGLTMSEQTRNIKGGLILTDGSVDTNYSLEALVSVRKNELTEQVTKILFD